MQLTIARVLLVLASVSALAAGVSTIGAPFAAPPETRIVEAWRMFGLLFFGGVFALLAWRPHGYRGVWELAILHKVALVVVAAVFLAGAGAAGAVEALVADGILVVVLVAAYLLARGWQAQPR